MQVSKQKTSVSEYEVGYYESLWSLLHNFVNEYVPNDMYMNLFIFFVFFSEKIFGKKPERPPPGSSFINTFLWDVFVKSEAEHEREMRQGMNAFFGSV